MKRMIRLVLLVSFLCSSVASFGKITHVLQIIPTYAGAKISSEVRKLMKITLLTTNRADSLVLRQHSNCSTIIDKHERFNGEYIWVGKSIPFREIKIEHPDFSSIVFPINYTDVDADSIDIFNKRHHILFHINNINLEKECDETPPHLIHFWSDLTPHKGVKCPQHVGILLLDTLTQISKETILQNYPVTIQKTSDNKKILLVKLKEGELKNGKNSILKKMLLDSLIIKDAGVVIDTSVITFISSFLKISCLPVKQIEKEKIEPITGLKSLAWQSGYIQANGLEWGAGLYRLKTGIGYDIIELQQEITESQLEKKCEEHDELIALDLEHLKLNTINLSNAGGKDKGKKRVNNTERMTEIKITEKDILASYNAPLGYLDIILIQEEFSSKSISDVKK